MSSESTLTGRATAAWRQRQRDAAEAERLAAIRAEIAPDDPVAVRAAEQWQRETAQTRTSAAELAERLLSMPADPDRWTVRRDSTTVARAEVEGLNLAVWPLLQLGRGMTELVLGVALPGSKKPFQPIASLEELGQWLAEHAPPKQTK